MEYQKFIPEGWNSNEEYTLKQLQEAKLNGKIIEGKVISCDEDYNLHVNLGNNLVGIVPKDEFELSENIKPSVYRNKVNSCIQVKVTDASTKNILLSRKSVKRDAIEWVKNDLVNRRCSLRYCKKY